METGSNRRGKVDDIRARGFGLDFRPGSTFEVFKANRIFENSNRKRDKPGVGFGPIYSV